MKTLTAVVAKLKEPAADAAWGRGGRVMPAMSAARKTAGSLMTSLLLPSAATTSRMASKLLMLERPLQATVTSVA
jgi:hypothetical protein